MSHAYASILNPISILDISPLNNINIQVNLTNKDDIFCLQYGNCILSNLTVYGGYVNVSVVNYNITGVSTFNDIIEIANDTRLFLGDLHRSWLQFVSSSNDLEIEANTGDVYVLSANFGIGTSSPTHKLSIGGGLGEINLMEISSFETDFYVDYSASTGTHPIRHETSLVSGDNDYSIYSGGLKRLTLDSAGDLYFIQDSMRLYLGSTPAWSISSDDTDLITNRTSGTGDFIIPYGKPIFGRKKSEANYFVDFLATSSEQYVARFTGIRSDFAGFVVAANHTTGIPYIQLSNPVNGLYGTLELTQSGDIIIKRGNAGGPTAMNITPVGGAQANVVFPAANNFNIGHTSNLRDINLWVIDYSRSVVDPGGNAGIVVQTPEQYSARFIGENPSYAGIQITGTMTNARTFLQWYNLANADYFTGQLNNNGDLIWRQGTAVGTIIMEMDVNHDIHFPIDNQFITMGAADETDYSQTFDGTNAEFTTSGDFVFNSDTRVIGDLNQTKGNATINLIYASLGNNATGTIAIPVQNVYYNITNVSLRTINGFQFNTTGYNDLTVIYNGLYKPDSGGDFSGGANTEYHIRISVNNKASACHSGRKIGTGGDLGYAATVPCFLYLHEGDVLQLQIENVDNTNSITYKDIGFTIFKIGE